MPADRTQVVACRLEGRVEVGLPTVEVPSLHQDHRLWQVVDQAPRKVLAENPVRQFQGGEPAILASSRPDS